MDADADNDIRDVPLDLGSVGVLYQPVVNLSTGSPVGYEALARGPRGGPMRRPDALFSAARTQDLTAELDWACRAAAFAGAQAAGLRDPWTLFVNVEPEVIDAGCPSAIRTRIAEDQPGLRTIFEVTERALADDPAALIEAIETMRCDGHGIALDDVGADWRSLALMPFIRPDVVKLDRHLVQGPLTPEGAVVADAVRVYCARWGAQIVAEGIENEAHLQRAIGLGASYGQGWMFGRPAPLPHVGEREAPSGPEFVIAHQPPDDDSVWEAVARTVDTAIGTKADLLAITHAIEQRAATSTEPSVVLTAFEETCRFTENEAALYSGLAARCAFVGVFGPGMSAEPAPGVRGADHDLNAQLGEWTVIFVGPHHAVALLARSLHDRGPDLERRYRYSVLSDRGLVLRVARTLMRRTQSKRALAAVARPGPSA